MKKLRMPDFKLNNFYGELLKGRHNNTKNNFLIDRLAAIKDFLVDQETEYERLATENSLHLILEQQKIVITDLASTSGSLIEVTAEESEKIYTDFLVEYPESPNKGRKIYKKILKNTLFGICPYCSEREVKTVDHYFPKSKFISFVVTPINLLPCCTDCNKEKLDYFSTQENKMLIHPYFDDLRDFEWLECKVIEDTWPISFEYEVTSVFSDETLRLRVKNQFEVLKLADFYAPKAALEFYNRSKRLVEEYNSNPLNKAKDFLEGNYRENFNNNKNSWQTAMYKALLSSQWFQNSALSEIERKYTELYYDELLWSVN